MPNNLVLPSAGSKISSRASSKTLRSRQSPLTYAPALAILTLGKASRVFASFVSFHYLQDRVALPLYLFFVTLGAAVTLLALQRPWTGKRIGAKRARRVLLAGGLLAATLYVWTAGLRSAGPLRTLLVDGAELPLLYLFAVVSRRELPERRKTRGAVCMLLAYCLLVWDASGHVPDVRELEHTGLGQRAEHMVGRLRHAGEGRGADWEDADTVGAPGDLGAMHEAEVNEAQALQMRRRRLLTTYKPPVKGSGSMRDAFVEGTGLRCEFGVVLVLAASVLVQSGRGFSRRLATELGGAKRHFALSMTAACAWIMPLAGLSWVSNRSADVLSLQSFGGITRVEITGALVVGFLSVGFLWLVVPYYARAVVSTALPQRTMMQSAVVSPFVMAGVVVAVFGEGVSAGGFSWVIVLAFVLVCCGIGLMMAGGVKRGLSELPIDSSGSVASRVGDGGSGQFLESGRVGESEGSGDVAGGGPESERDTTR